MHFKPYVCVGPNWSWKPSYFISDLFKKYKVKIEDTKLDGIINDLLRYIYLTLTRTLYNKERESLMQQFHSRETISQAEKKGMLSGLREGMRI